MTARAATRPRPDAYADRAADVLAVLRQVQAEGVGSLRAIAAELHARGVLTPAGKAQWSPEQVRRLLARGEAASAIA